MASEIDVPPFTAPYIVENLRSFLRSILNSAPSLSEPRSLLMPCAEEVKVNKVKSKKQTLLIYEY